MAAGVQLDDFDITPMSFRNRTRDVLVARASGRPVIVMHEIFGLSPTLVDFARVLVAAGFKVYMPVLFGATDPSNPRWLRAMPCVLFEFRMLMKNDPGPWADWIRDLASFAYNSGAPVKGVGVIGLCLTGNLALSAALNPHVTAPVMSEPSLPILRAGGLHVSPDELAAVKMRVAGEGLVIRGYRFELDRICKRARFDDFGEAFGAGFQGTCIPTGNNKLHSVFTEDLRDENGNLRHGELQTLISFLQERT
ncbi:MAG TPA: dienelactone hydrolase family protein [Xanthobacteraceae bacterium]|nr:dienelactone hydrolase family protein [Xanthobacteraceae bacterium]